MLLAEQTWKKPFRGLLKRASEVQSRRLVLVVNVDNVVSSDNRDVQRQITWGTGDGESRDQLCEADQLLSINP